MPKHDQCHNYLTALVPKAEVNLRAGHDRVVLIWHVPYVEPVLCDFEPSL
jgi:hypothetical protein